VTIVLAIFLLGCLVAAIVAMGLVFAMSTLSPDGPGSFEGKALEDEGA